MVKDYNHKKSNEHYLSLPEILPYKEYTIRAVPCSGLLTHAFHIQSSYHDFFISDTDIVAENMCKALNNNRIIDEYHKTIDLYITNDNVDECRVNFKSYKYKNYGNREKTFSYQKIKKINEKSILIRCRKDSYKTYTVKDPDYWEYKWR